MNDKFLGRCNGYKGMLTPSTQAGVDVFAEVIDECRAQFESDFHNDFGYYGKYETGPRFRDNAMVMARIWSAVVDDSEFLARPRAWVMDALRDCAEADHWYAYEKDWD